MKPLVEYVDYVDIKTDDTHVSLHTQSDRRGGS